MMMVSLSFCCDAECFVCVSPVVTVSWTQGEYASTEESIFQVCAQHIETTETPFSVSISPPNSEGTRNSEVLFMFNLLQSQTLW